MTGAARPAGTLRRAITLATVASLLLLTVGVIPARAASLANFPTSNAVIAGDWLGLDFAYADDNSFAVGVLPKSTNIGVAFGNFGFDAIPAGATIDSVTAEARLLFTADAATTDAVVSIGARVDGTPSGSPATDATRPIAETTITNTTLGITSRGQLLDGRFELLVGATRGTSGPPDPALQIDYVRVTVEYTPPPVNEQPFLDPIPDQTVVAGTSKTITLTASDPDGDIVRFEEIYPGGTPSWVTLTDNGDNTATLAMAPGPGDVGAFNPLVIQVTDPGGLAFSRQLNVAVTANQPPTIEAIPNQTVAAGTTVTYQVVANDPEGGPLTFGSTGFPAWASIDASTGLITMSPPADAPASSHGVGVYVADPLYPPDNNHTATTFFTIFVTADQPPVLAPIGDQTVAEGATKVVTITATDPDGDPIAFVAGPALPAFATFVDNGDGTATLTLAPGFTDAGTYPLTVGAVAGAGLDTEAFQIIVTDVDQPPVLDPIGDQTVAEGATKTVTITASDPDGDALSFVASGLPSFATLVDNGDGTATLTISPQDGDAASSPYPVTIGVTDLDETDLEGFDLVVTDTDTVAPVVTVPADMTKEATSAAGAVVTFTASATDDVDGSRPVTCTPASGSTFPLGDTTVTCTATDAAGNTGSASFMVTVADTTAPSITTPDGTTPPDLTVPATGPNGAVVSFVLGATDGVDGELTPTCAPASGSLFPVGTTTVTCTVTDRAGNVGSVAFSVTVSPYDGVTPTPPPTSTERQAVAGAVGGTSALLVLWLLGMTGALGLLAVGVRRRRA